MAQTAHGATVLVGSIRRLLRRGATSHVQRIVAKTRPEDIGLILPELGELEAQRLVKMLAEDPETLADIIPHVEETLLGAVLAPLGLDRLSKVFQELATDDQADLLAALDPEIAEQLISRLPQRDADEVSELLAYPEDTAGGIMATEFFSLPADSLVQDAVEALRAFEDVDGVFYVYCLDDEGRLAAVSSMRQLLLAPVQARIRDVANTEVLTVPVDLDQEEVARRVARYDLLAIPVVDEFQRMVGVVTVDDVIDVLREEATEDIMKMVGVADDLLGTSVARALRGRLPWLVWPVLGGLTAAAVIRWMSPNILEYAIVSAFIPVIAGMAGNAGSQSATMVVRGLATGRLTPAMRRMVLGREMRTGLAMGLMAGTTIGLASLLFTEVWFGLAIVVAGALCLAMTVAVVIGVSVPVVFTRLGVDPALATGPVLTTSIDLLGTSTYLGAALWLLEYL